MKAIKTTRKHGKRLYQVFLPGMKCPSFHAHKEEARWAVRLRGYMVRG